MAFQLDSPFGSAIATVPISQDIRVRIDTATDNTSVFGADTINVVVATATSGAIGVTTTQQNVQSNVIGVKLFRPTFRMTLSSGSGIVSPGTTLYATAGGYVGDISLSGGNAALKYLAGQDGVAGDTIQVFFNES